MRTSDKFCEDKNHVLFIAHCPENSISLIQLSSVAQFVRLFANPWTEAHQASLSITNSQSLLKLISIRSVIPSNHLILCRPLLLPPSIFPCIRVFSNESVRHIRWPKYWSFNFSISPSSEIRDWFPLGCTGWISLQSKGLSRVFSNTIVQKHPFFGDSHPITVTFKNVLKFSSILSLHDMH